MVGYGNATFGILIQVEIFSTKKTVVQRLKNHTSIILEIFKTIIDAAILIDQKVAILTLHTFVLLWIVNMTIRNLLLFNTDIIE